MNKVIHRIATRGIGKLHLEEACRDIKYALLRVHLLTTHAYSIDEVRLATAGRSEDKERIERRLPWMLGNGQTNRTRQLIGVALDETLEGLVLV